MPRAGSSSPGGWFDCCQENDGARPRLINRAGRRGAPIFPASRRPYLLGSAQGSEYRNGARRPQTRRFMPRRASPTVAPQLYDMGGRSSRPTSTSCRANENFTGGRVLMRPGRARPSSKPSRPTSFLTPEEFDGRPPASCRSTTLGPATWAECYNARASSLQIEAGAASCAGNSTAQVATRKSRW